MIKIKLVQSKKDLRRFTEFPNKLFKHEPSFVPALSIDEMNVFNKAKNPAHEYCESQCFLAYKDNILVGRVAGIINHKWNEANNTKIGRFSRIDMIDDIEVTKALIEAVTAWNKSFGMDTLIGPIGFTDLDRMGMLVDGFEYLNMFITIWNPKYYHEHLEQLGFVKDADWIEKRIMLTSIPEKISKVADITQRRYGFKLVKCKKRKEIYKYIYPAFNMYNVAFNELYGFHPISDRVMDYYIKQMISIVKLDYLWFVLDTEDNVAGFGLMMPSLANANKKNNGRLFPFGFLRILRALKKHDVVDLYFIAVDPKHQGKGLPALMLEDGINEAMKRKIQYAETGPELETNLAIQAQWKDFDYINHRRRRCYTKSI
ncbi:GNAT superfamily N-acetyltransferase [Acholeplasma morum]|uniref:GNAT family N-acetyltransferase n=1 Tax=Paracholeplasma morum TaxID=264637 RepID=UPI00195AFD14|nr:GNAT family N-acetyltransferase [Paracholeplasma morum]MBM7453192.1 GNAT superfamily N-acetyltransferase [Paracholeplasma morum]